MRSRSVHRVATPRYHCERRSPLSVNMFVSCSELESKDVSRLREPLASRPDIPVSRPVNVSTQSRKSQSNPRSRRSPLPGRRSPTISSVFKHSTTISRNLSATKLSSTLIVATDLPTPCRLSPLRKIKRHDNHTVLTTRQRDSSPPLRPQRIQRVPSDEARSLPQQPGTSHGPIFLSFSMQKRAEHVHKWHCELSQVAARRILPKRRCVKQNQIAAGTRNTSPST